MIILLKYFLDSLLLLLFGFIFLWYFPSDFNSMKVRHLNLVSLKYLNFAFGYQMLEIQLNNLTWGLNNLKNER